MTAGLNGSKGGAEALLDPLWDKFEQFYKYSGCKKIEGWGNT